MKTKKGGLTYDSAKTELASVKEELGVASSELKDFLKSNKLKRDEDHSKHSDKKIAKQYNALVAAVDAKQNRKDELLTFLKNNKPEPKERESKYNYPSEVESTLDKKKYRASMRSNAKKAGVELDTYLADPKKYAKVIAEKEKARAEKLAKKTAPKKKKKAAEEEAPVKKLKLKKSAEEEAPKKKLKKKVKAAPAPEAEEEEAGGED